MEATVRALNILLTQALGDYHATLEAALSSASDDCVNMLAGEGASFQELRDQVVGIRKATSEQGLEYLWRARAAVQQIWPILQAEGLDGEMADHGHLLKDRLDTGTYYPATKEIKQALAALKRAGRDLYTGRHKQRQEVFGQAVTTSRRSPIRPRSRGDGGGYAKAAG